MIGFCVVTAHVKNSLCEFCSYSHTLSLMYGEIDGDFRHGGFRIIAPVCWWMISQLVLVLVLQVYSVHACLI